VSEAHLKVATARLAEYMTAQPATPIVIPLGAAAESAAR